jgi:hypothetical protein
LRALYESPLTVPLNPAAVFVGVGVAVCVCVGVAVALAVADALGFAVAVAVAVAVVVVVEFFVGVEVGFAVAVALFVGVAAGVVVGVAGVAGVAVGVLVPPPRAIPPPTPTVPTELLSAGGVIERTAPKPVTVPAAIKIAFFISVLSRLFLRAF